MESDKISVVSSRPFPTVLTIGISQIYNALWGLYEATKSLSTNRNMCNNHPLLTWLRRDGCRRAASNESFEISRRRFLAAAAAAAGRVTRCSRAPTMKVYVDHLRQPLFCPRQDTWPRKRWKG